MAEILAKKRADKEQKRKAKEEERIAQHAAARAALEAIVLADIWTQEQQTAFESALLENTPMVEKHERWSNIAAAIPGGKTKNQCILRYKFLKEYVALKKRNLNTIA